MAEQVEEPLIVPRHRFRMELERERRIDVALNGFNHSHSCQVTITLWALNEKLPAATYCMAVGENRSSTNM